jgi:LysM repeat protein
LLAIATKHKIDLAKLLDYNELEADGLIDEYSWIYLERKHKYAAQDFHIAEVGDTYYSIAQSHGVQLEKILEYNNIDEDDEVAPGTQVWLKDNGNTQSNPSLQVKTITHKVQQGEGLYAVARKYNVTVEDIRKLNGLQSDVLQVGQELIISK